MASYPYAQPISGLEQIINRLKKTYLKELNAGTLKSLGIAPNNESYIINTLKALSLYDAEGKPVESSKEIFVKSGDEFSAGFAELIKKVYVELFDTFLEEAWTLGKPELVNFFRAKDKSSDLVGNRQADTFIKLAEIAQKRQPSVTARPVSSRTVKDSKERGKEKPQQEQPSASKTQAGEPEVALTVRIEVNLPPASDQATYDAIFRSIREQLIDREQN